jgi:hypothetical protein
VNGFTGVGSGDKVCAMHKAVMGSGEILCKVVAEIFCAWFPVDDELFLVDSISDPIKRHIHCSGLALFECVVCNAGCSGVVGFDRCRRLFVAKYIEGCLQGNCFLPIDEEASYFCFGGGGHDGM